MLFQTLATLLAISSVLFTDIYSSVILIQYHYAVSYIRIIYTIQLILN